MIEFSREDLLSSTIVKPAWYRVLIKNVSAKLSKDAQSTNYPIEGTILFNADDGSKEFENVPLNGIPSWFFNSKAKWAMIGIIKAVDPTADIGPGFRFNEKALEGKEIDVYVDNELYEGTIRNRVNHKYRAPRTVAA
jgi:hypothetical protein